MCIRCRQAGLGREPRGRGRPGRPRAAATVSGTHQLYRVGRTVATVPGNSDAARRRARPGGCSGGGGRGRRVPIRTRSTAAAGRAGQRRTAISSSSTRRPRFEIERLCADALLVDGRGIGALVSRRSSGSGSPIGRPAGGSTSRRRSASALSRTFGSRWSWGSRGADRESTTPRGARRCSPVVVELGAVGSRILGPRAVESGRRGAAEYPGGGVLGAASASRR